MLNIVIEWILREMLVAHSFKHIVYYYLLKFIGNYKIVRPTSHLMNFTSTKF